MLMLLMLFSCNKSSLIIYEKNMQTYKYLINDINNYYKNSDDQTLNIDKYFTSDCKLHYFPVGSPKGISLDLKDYKKNILMFLKKDGVSINVGHSIYLPGIDENNYKIDGSVRVYYKITLTNDRDIELSAYRTINFRDGKISALWEWADYGGAIKQLYEK